MPAMTDLITDSRVAGTAAGPPAVGPPDHEISADRRQEFEEMLPSVMPRFRSIATHWLGNREDRGRRSGCDAFSLQAHHQLQRPREDVHFAHRDCDQCDTHADSTAPSSPAAFDGLFRERRPTGNSILTDRRPTPEKAAEQLELYELAMKLTRRLPPSQRAAMCLRYEADFSIKRASRKLGVPAGTLKAQLAVAALNLRNDS
jgi:Sigma-70, region 4